MRDFSSGEGFVEVTEDLADMIKFVANEPSVGLFYVQQHTQNAAPNLINLKNNVAEKSHETSLHTEDLEDSILMVRSMKECGFPIADGMIEEIKKSLSIMSLKKPKRGLIQASSPSFLARTRSWTPSTTWGRNPKFDDGSSGGYLSSVLKSAKQRANDFKWVQTESAESSHSKVENSGNSSSAAKLDSEVEDLPLSSRNESELEEESPIGKSLSQQELVSLYENYEEFKADREAKLEQWLGSSRKDDDGDVTQQGSTL
ncbi:uncharacterized protein LOC127251254 [Andrographis paniculata]|uniref:uncharacterized protein LOC127251254 n=1 Tax=Andrographis paniculata TaxID=175694 RepID=UPI0021E773B8|nr:uncharacterized protein LOC127251254 [Andrographis paniculata]